MTLRIIGAGLGRTGTASLKAALEHLLGAPCYHMFEVENRPGDLATWREAAQGNSPDWVAFFDGYAAAVDWPVAAFWEELAEAFPDAPILLSHRDANAWWRSAHDTIFPASVAAQGEWGEMLDALFSNRFTAALDDRQACVDAYLRHNDNVRRRVPSHRLVEWQPGDGWAPLCRALGIAEPEEPFPHTNTTREFLSRKASPDG